jgi:PAS domain S-box-containing protein
LSRLVHIVDDDTQVRAATSYFLTSHGYQTEIYSGGRELLRDGKLNRGCILLDLRMPEMNGHEVQEELVRRGVELPVIVMSAHGDLTSAVKAMKLGAVDFLTKPPQEGELLAAIERAIGQFEQGRDLREARAKAAARIERLSPRETQILEGLLAGLSNKAMARQLGLSPRTIEMHRANMMDELGVASLPEAVRLAIDGGLQPLGQENMCQVAPPPAARGAGGGVSAGSDRGDEDERMRLALEAASDGAWDWNLATGEIAMSKQFMEWLGYEPCRSTRVERIRELTHPDDRERVAEAVRRHLAGETETYACQYRVGTIGGGWAWICDRGRIVDRDPATGAPLRMIGSSTDVTELKLQEEQVRGQAELLSLARLGTGIGQWDLDLASSQLRLCPRSRELHGLGSDGPELLSEGDWAALLHPEDVAAARASVEEAMRTGGTSVAEYRTTAGGQTRWVLGMGRVVTDSAGQPLRMVGLNQDITERKQGNLDQKRLQEAQIRFSEVSAVGTMASTLAHELNQPLTAIANFVRGIRRRLSDGPALEDARLEEALTGTERSAHLASEILGRIRSQIAFDEVKRSPASLSAVIRESCALALFDAEERGIRYACDLDECADRVVIDAIQIQQLLLNLLRNAVEALADAPGGRRQLAISSRRLGSGEVEVRVVDSGPGISAHLRERLFEPFATSKPGGTGLGLSISRTIAEAHGGRIWAEDPEAGGAALCFTLAD